MPLQTTPLSYDHYLSLNKFAGGQDLIDEAERIPEKPGEQERRGLLLVDGIRLLQIAHGPYGITKELDRYAAFISASHSRNNIRLELLRAERERQQGYYTTAYNRLVELQKKLRGLYADDDRPEWLSRTFYLPLLAAINMLAGKCMARSNDHSMARVHYGLSYDRRHHDPNSTEHYTDAQIRTAFARSYLGWRKTKDMSVFFDAATDCYRRLFSDAADKNGKPCDHLYVSEVYCTRAREHSDRKRRGIRELLDIEERRRKRKRMYNTVQNDLKAAEEIVTSIFDENHRRYANVLRLRNYFLLEEFEEEMQEDRGNLPCDTPKQLKKVIDGYLKEIAIRSKFFHNHAHLSLARAENYLARAYLLLAEFYAQQNKLADCQTNLDLAKDRLKKAHGHNKLPNDIAQENKDLQHHLLADRINDFEAYETMFREMEAEALRYIYLTENDKKSTQFAKITKLYKTCRLILSENLRWMTSYDSRETFFDLFSPAQELYIELCYAEVNRYKQRGDEEHFTMEALRAMQLGNYRREQTIAHGDTPLDASDDLPMRMFQTSAYRRLLNKTGEIATWSKKDEEARKKYYFDANKIIDLQLAEVASLQLKRKNGQLGSGTAEDAFKTDNIDNITKAFHHNGDDPHSGTAVAVALHFGAKHIYAVIINDRRKDDRPTLEFKRLTTEKNAYRGVIEMRLLSLDFHRITKYFTSDKRQEKLLFQRPEEATITDGEKQQQLKNIRCRLVEEDEFIYDPTQNNPNAADRKNSEFLCAGYKLYSRVFSPLGLEEGDRLYIGLNRYSWQRLLLRTLYTKDPEKITRGTTLRFSKLADDFLGIQRQISVIPSIFELSRWADEGHQPPLTANLFALSGGSYKQWDDFTLKARASAGEVCQIFETAHITRAVSPPLTDFLLQVNENRKNARKLILKKLIWADYIYLFVHTGREANKDGMRKIRFFDSNDLRKERNFVDAFTRDENSLYHEELLGLSLQATLTFINGCHTADGRGRIGYIPYSMLSALYKAKSKVVIGSQQKTYPNAMEEFAQHFYQLWVGNRVLPEEQETGLTIGESIRRASKFMTANGSRFSHPIHWGNYIIIGDMSRYYHPLA